MQRSIYGTAGKMLASRSMVKRRKQKIRVTHKRIM